MIQPISQLQHLHQLFGQAFLDLHTVEVVHPIVEVSNPKDYLTIFDHGGAKVVKADPSTDFLVVLVPALKFDDASGQVGVDEAGGHVVKVPSCHQLSISQEIFLFEPSDN